MRGTKPHLVFGILINVFITSRFSPSSSAYRPFRPYIAGDGSRSESFEVLHLCEDASLAKVEKVEHK